jgi:transposase
MDSEFRAIKSRQYWVETYEKLGSVSKAAQKCGIPRSTLYRWIKRYRIEGDRGLASKSKRPLKLAKIKITQNDEEKILSLREQHKWGPQRLSTHFLREEEISLSPSSIWRVLKKY